MEDGCCNRYNVVVCKYVRQRRGRGKFAAWHGETWTARDTAQHISDNKLLSNCKNKRKSNSIGFLVKRRKISSIILLLSGVSVTNRMRKTFKGDIRIYSFRIKSVTNFALFALNCMITSFCLSVNMRPERRGRGLGGLGGGGLVRELSKPESSSPFDARQADLGSRGRVIQPDDVRIDQSAGERFSMEPPDRSLFP